MNAQEMMMQEMMDSLPEGGNLREYVIEMKYCIERVADMAACVVIILKEQERGPEAMHAVCVKVPAYLRDARWDTKEEHREFLSKMLLWARDETQKYLGY